MRSLALVAYLFHIQKDRMESLAENMGKVISAGACKQNAFLAKDVLLSRDVAVRVRY